MDFDGFPELLVTHTEISEKSNMYADVDIYRISREDIEYIDTVYNYHSIYETDANTLSLITLDDGRKGWYSVSYKNTESPDENGTQTDYIYILNGNEPERIEMFSSVSNDNSETEYFFMEKKMEIVREEYVPTAEDLENEEYPEFVYEWNDMSAGSEFEVYTAARQQLYERIEETYYLYSDWISDIKYDKYDTDFCRYSLSERDITFNIANMLNKYFCGKG